MSTLLDQLIAKGILRAYKVMLGPRREPLRRVLVCDEFDTFVASLSTVKNPRRALSERAEIDVAVADFIGRAKLGGLVRDVNPPKGQDIMDVHTPQLRLFGWAAADQTLLLASGERKSVLADKSNDRTYKILALEAVNVRKRLKLDDWVKGAWHEVFRIND